jgi:hypothetical protein
MKNITPFGLESFSAKVIKINQSWGIARQRRNWKICRKEEILEKGSLQRRPDKV